MRILGVNAVFHDPAAALIMDGRVVAAAEEERFSRRKHGKRPVPFSAWELPELAIRWCLPRPACMPATSMRSPTPSTRLCARPPGSWASTTPGTICGRSTRVVRRGSSRRPCPAWIRTWSASCPTMWRMRRPRVWPRRPRAVRVLVLDGRGERASHLAGHYVDGRLEVLAAQALPHSLGLLYEDLTEHLGFLRSSDEYKVMALASYGRPRHLERLPRARSYRPATAASSPRRSTGSPR